MSSFYTAYDIVYNESSYIFSPISLQDLADSEETDYSLAEPEEENSSYIFAEDKYENFGHMLYNVWRYKTIQTVILRAIYIISYISAILSLNIILALSYPGFWVSAGFIIAHLLYTIFKNAREVIRFRYVKRHIKNINLYGEFADLLSIHSYDINNKTMQYINFVKQLDCPIFYTYAVRKLLFNPIYNYDMAVKTGRYTGFANILRISGMKIENYIRIYKTLYFLTLPIILFYILVKNLLLYFSMIRGSPGDLFARAWVYGKKMLLYRNTDYPHTFEIRLNNLRPALEEFIASYNSSAVNYKYILKLFILLIHISFVVFAYLLSWKVELLRPVSSYLTGLAWFGVVLSNIVYKDIQEPFLKKETLDILYKELDCQNIAELALTVNELYKSKLSIILTEIKALLLIPFL